MKRAAIAIAMLLAFGAARLPLEIRLQRDQQKAGFHTASLDLPLREQLGQLSFVAALSGFRSLVAAVIWIEAHDSFEKIEWGRMAGQLRTVTTLQPKSTLYWDMSAWHMAWNASVAALEDKKQQSKTLRSIEAKRYWELGKKFYEDGIKNNPDSVDLWAGLGRLESDKFEDHLAAAKAFDTASAKPRALPYLRRRAAYELAMAPGHEREAYDRLKALYDEGAPQRLPSVVASLKRLEEKLGIPAAQRIKGDTVH